MPVPTISTKRLTLRHYQESDAEALHLVFSDENTMRWWSVAPHQSVAETKAHIADLREKFPHLSCWLITDESNVALGWVTLRGRHEGVANLGYILNRDYHGRGYAREAASAIIDHGFAVMGWRRITAEVDPENAASVRLLELLGFQYEGRLRAEWETHLGVRDSLFYGLLAAEWGRVDAGGEKIDG